MGHRNRRGLIALASAAILVASPCLLAWTQPALAAFTCPSCFGFERIESHVYVDGGMRPDQRIGFARSVERAEGRVDSFYGGLKEKPVILACSTEACFRRLGGGGALGVSYATIGLRLSPFGLDPTIVAHERSHIELHGRIGWTRWLEGAVPAWFDEGLAVLVSDDPRYLKPQGSGDRCRTEPGEALPASSREWMVRASADRDLYAQAACRVSRWLAAHGGNAAASLLLDRVAAGMDFAQAFNQLQTD